jgi:sugar phosphate permease
LDRTLSSSPEAAREHRRTQETMALLFVGYAGYYFCRTFFASIKPILIAIMALLIILAVAVLFIMSRRREHRRASRLGVA